MTQETDQELLTFAAKASGIGPILCYESKRNCLRIGDRKSYTLWRPFTCGNDALRLAVTLDIEFYRANDEGLASYAGYWGKPERLDITRMFCIEYDDDINNMGDSFTATCRAIVRAAAEIGKAM